MHCIEKEGKVIWHNASIAVDGVIINNFEAGEIYGSGELDSTGGWQDFVISLTTGEIIK